MIEQTLAQWLNSKPEFLYEYQPIELSQTYAQWLEQNPLGYVVNDADVATDVTLH